MARYLFELESPAQCISTGNRRKRETVTQSKLAGSLTPQG